MWLAWMWSFMCSSKSKFFSQTVHMYLVLLLCTFSWWTLAVWKDSNVFEQSKQLILPSSEGSTIFHSYVSVPSFRGCKISYGLTKKRAVKTGHSRPMRNQMKLKETLTGPAQGEKECRKDSKYILFKSYQIGHGRVILAPAGQAA